MDNLAHALVGAALGRVTGDGRVPRAALLGAVAANLPDITELLYRRPLRGITYLELHRGFTHSLAGAALEIAAGTLLVGLLLAWRGRRRGTAAPWGALLTLFAAAVASHLYMDWQGSYGLRPFLPWSERWYYADWVAIVDPFFWLVPLVALAWGSERHWRPLTAVILLGALMTWVVFASGEAAPWVQVAWILLTLAGAHGWVAHWAGVVARRRAAAVALVLLGAYALASGIAAWPVKARTARAARLRFGPAARWAVLTRPGQPFTWEPVLAGPDSVAGPDWTVARHLDAPAVRRALATPDGAAIAQFARFLTADVDSSGTGTTVYLRDARYALAGRRGWAVVVVRLGPAVSVRRIP
jgi:inner membrane protein